MRMARLIGICGAIVGLVVFPGATRASNEFPREPLKPHITIGRSVPMTEAQVNRVIAAAQEVGASGHVLTFPVIGLTAHRRGEVELMRLTDRWRIPMATMVVSQQYIRTVGGDVMAQAAAPGQLLLGESAAKYRKAQVGDTLVLRDAKFQPQSFVVGAIVPDAFVDWGDITISTESASVLGGFRRSRVVITDIPSWEKISRSLKSKKITSANGWRHKKSWEIENPDGTLGTSSVKKLLGEFSYRPAGGRALQISTEWRAAHLEWKKVFTDIPLINNCHKQIAPAIQGALSEIKKEGLASKIDVRNSNRYGGCFAARYNRLSGSFGPVTRHAWGMALDINTVTNAQGAAPQLNCDVVRIFRKWGFAWGGNFRPADGMHFEYVGKPLHDLGYPSRYCPNNVAIPTTTLPKFDDDVPVVTSTTLAFETTTTAP